MPTPPIGPDVSINRTGQASTKVVKGTSKGGEFRSVIVAGHDKGLAAKRKKGVAALKPLDIESSKRGGGVEIFDPKQPGDSLGVKYDSLLEAASLVTDRLPAATVAKLQRTSGLTQERIQQVAGISKGSYARRRKDGRLSREESERLLRLSRLFERATSMYEGDQAGAREWLETPIPALGGQSPLDLAQTEPGAREVEDLIGRIERGVVS